ncbi:DUF4405 domain-containing protein [Pleurocapsa sp. FMAR1]|uniref:DUF4405 domain-containing protein n=1 Tax=Pleurocapsa sp. FMAR1 TaxID=3040204 RepID=UPI0029C827D5|nr:DUF4405 domain-containing protein [Pleurocapsa sp. FMAR1]
MAKNTSGSTSIRSEARLLSGDRLNLYLDLGIFLLSIVLSAPLVTGIAAHEWLSIIFIIPIVTHLLLHWRWIVNVTRRFFLTLPRETRFNHFWDVLLFVVMTLIIFSGLLVSQEALPFLGISIKVDPFWQAIHNITANLFLILLGIHIAMHWNWLLRVLRLRKASEGER